LIQYGVDKVVGNNLVRYQELNLRDKHGKKIGHTLIKPIEDALGYPWWLVHRHHLHNGLVEVARNSGVKILIDSRVARVHHACSPVKLTTQQGKEYSFDIVLGCDGVNSTIRKTLFPNVSPRPSSGNCAYRAIVPYDEIRKDPLAKQLVEDKDGNLIRTMEVWMSPTGYIISYPISDTKHFNIVLSHFCEPPVDKVNEASIDEVQDEYKTYDPRIKRIIEMIRPPISRWPLLLTGPLSSWSNEEKNVVLIGDAAHSMTK
jgi:salicylate hydroxylase